MALFSNYSINKELYLLATWHSSANWLHFRHCLPASQPAIHRLLLVIHDALHAWCLMYHASWTAKLALWTMQIHYQYASSILHRAPLSRLRDYHDRLRDHLGWVQGWESVCWGVLGIPLFVNWKVSCLKIVGFQSFKSSQFHNFKVSKFHSFKFSKCHKIIFKKSSSRIARCVGHTCPNYAKCLNFKFPQTQFL